MNIKPILIATAVALIASNANAKCTINYNCGTGASGCPADTTNRNSISTLEFTAPTAPTRDGYVFTGWQTNRTDTTVYAPGNTISWTLANNKTCATATTTDGRITVTAQWAANFNVTYANGGGTGNAPSGPTSCTGGETCNAPENTYTYADHVFTGWACTRSGTSCGTFLPGASISNATSTGGDTITLTAKWIDGIPLKTPTSKSYVDSQMNALQPQFSGLGANKLMTYGTTAGAVGSRDIVTELGTSTTANSIPTMGAILSGLNGKQPTMNGTAGWVAENTGTAGSLKAKPVYSTTNNYRQALVTAGDLNQIVTDAVNSELIRVDETGEPNANGTLWKLNDIANLTLPTLRVLLPDSSIKATSYCYRSLSGTRNSNGTNGTCNAATLATLGASGNKSAMWGVVFPYGDMVGKSVCYNASGNYLVAETESSEYKDSLFNAQSGVGESALNYDQKYCWCKLDSIAGMSVESKWVYFMSYARFSASNCAQECAQECASKIWNGTDSTYGTNIVQAMFNSVTQ